MSVSLCFVYMGVASLYKLSVYEMKVNATATPDFSILSCGCTNGFINSYNVDR